MKLLIKSIEEHPGKDFNPRWKDPMYLVNGKYLASSIPSHNINDEKFDLKVNEVAEVEFQYSARTPKHLWIDRISDKKLYEIQDALSMNVPNTVCYVYRIVFGKDCYIGFTTKDPKKRLEDHKIKSRNGGTHKINKAFRKWGYICELEIIDEYPNEILGLVAEVANIQKYDSNLNESEGGEGRDFEIIQSKNEYGEDTLMVYDRNGLL